MKLNPEKVTKHGAREEGGGELQDPGWRMSLEKKELLRKGSWRRLRWVCVQQCLQVCMLETISCVVSFWTPVPPQAHLSLSSFPSCRGSRSSLPPVHLSALRCLLRRVIVLLTLPPCYCPALPKISAEPPWVQESLTWLPRTHSQLPGHPSVTACIPVVTSDSLHVGCPTTKQYVLYIQGSFLFWPTLAQCLASCRCRFLNTWIHK